MKEKRDDRRLHSHLGLKSSELLVLVVLLLLLAGGCQGNEAQEERYRSVC